RGQGAPGAREGGGRGARPRGDGDRQGRERAAEAQDAPALEEDRDQHAGLRQDEPAPQGGRKLGLSGRLAAAVLLAAAAVGCASATSYLDPAAPFYAFRREAEPPEAPAPGQPLRVVSFNIAYAIEIERAIEVLRGSGPLRGADLIAQALGLNAVYFPSGVHPKHDRDFGCALLSPWPLVEPRKLVLPHGAR